MIVYRGLDSPQVRALYFRGIAFAALGVLVLGCIWLIESGEFGISLQRMLMPWLFWVAIFPAALLMRESAIAFGKLFWKSPGWVADVSVVVVLGTFVMARFFLTL